MMAMEPSDQERADLPHNTRVYLEWLEAKAPAPSWQPISSAPKDGCFLAYDKSIGVCILERYTFEGKYTSVVTEIGGGAGEYDDDEVTHWMPLPAPPEAD